EPGEVERVPPGDPEARVVHDAYVVVPAHPRGHAAMGVLEAHHDAADHRVPVEEGEAEDRPDQERVTGEVVLEPAAEAGPPGPGQVRRGRAAGPGGRVRG